VCEELKRLHRANIVLRDGTATKTRPAWYCINFDHTTWRIRELQR